MSTLKTTLRISNNRYDKVSFKDLKLNDKICLFYSNQDNLNSFINKKESIIDYGNIDSVVELNSVSNSIFSINKVNERNKDKEKNMLVIVRKNSIITSSLSNATIEIGDHIYLFEKKCKNILLKNKNFIGSYLVTQPLHPNNYNIECIDIKTIDI